jgi:hypothetical protein
MQDVVLSADGLSQAFEQSRTNQALDNNACFIDGSLAGLTFSICRIKLLDKNRSVLSHSGYE